MWGDRELLGASYLLPGWSVSAEWAAYVAFPVLAVGLRPLRRLPAAVLLAAGVAAITPLAFIAFTTGPLNYDQHWQLRIACGFTAGALCALGVGKLRPAAALESAATALLWVSVGLVPAAAMWASWRVAGGPGQDYTGVVVVLFPLLVVALSLTERGPARLLSSPALVYGGRISYSLYLVHFVVFEVAITVAWRDQAMIGVLTPGLALAAPVLVLVCFFVAAGLHHGVEEPARVVMLRLAGGSPPRVLASRHSVGGSMAGTSARGSQMAVAPAPATVLARPAVPITGPAVPETAVLASLPPVARTRMRIAAGSAVREVHENVVARV
jgi:peptidoglycan/LPS O-acetylase OafA/YrhL